MKADLVVIGGGPAGIEAALTYRALNPAAKIVLIRDSKKQLIPCAIPYIFTRIPLEKNIIGDEVFERNSIELIVDKAMNIDRFSRKVILEGHGEVKYEYLVLATGSKPSKLGVKGEELDGVFYVKENYDRMVKLKEKVNEASSIVIVGGGLAGVEIANELVEAGYKVTIVELLKHILMLNFDEDFAIKVENYLKDKGVEIVTNASIASFEGNGKLERVTLSNGERIEADVAIITTGIVANVELAEKSGLQTTHYGVKVNPFMLTNDPRIYAVGDCAEKRDFVTKKPAKYMLASIATMEARVAAVNIAKGNIVKIEGIVPKYVSKIGNIVIGAAGLTENQAKENKLDYTALSMKVKDRYPPGIVETHDLEVKLLFMKGRRYLIGGQVLGHTDYVGSLVNTIGSLIENYVTAEDIIASSKAAHPLVTPSPIAEPLENIALNFLK